MKRPAFTIQNSVYKTSEIWERTPIFFHKIREYGSEVLDKNIRCGQLLAQQVPPL